MEAYYVEEMVAKAIGEAQREDKGHTWITRYGRWIRWGGLSREYGRKAVTVGYFKLCTSCSSKELCGFVFHETYITIMVVRRTLIPRCG